MARPVDLARRLRRANRAAATAFLVGGAFFSTGGYTSVVQVANEPEGGLDALSPDACWRWWGRQPRRLA